MLLKPWLRIAYNVVSVHHFGIFILIAQVFTSFLNINILNLSTFLQRFDVAAGEGDADAVNGHLSLNGCLASVL